METTTIQSLVPQGSFDRNGKTFYKFDCILANGMVGEVSSLTPDRWQVGAECVVKEHQNTKWGPRLKLDRAGYESKSYDAPKPSGMDRQDSIVTQWAIREAQTYLFGTAVKPDAVTLYDVWGVAKHLKAMHDGFDTWGGVWKEQERKKIEMLSPENCPPVPNTAPAHGDSDLPF